MHTPVLLEETLRSLNLKANDSVIDCTLGDGGHATAILENIKPRGTLLGIERDPEMLERAKQNLDAFFDRATLVLGTYRELASIAQTHGFQNVHGILFDLGVATWHFKGSGRGFSFSDDAPLDMRLNPQEDIPAAHELLVSMNERELEMLLREFGEELEAKRIAKAIAAESVVTAKDLARLIVRVKRNRRSRTHPATKTFQALRIAVNHEYEHLEQALAQTTPLLATGGRLAVITFHSGEDRIVKQFFKNSSLRVVSKKAIVPLRRERIQNPSARSAKLRFAEKL